MMMGLKIAENRAYAPFFRFRSASHPGKEKGSWAMFPVRARSAVQFFAGIAGFGLICLGQAFAEEQSAQRREAVGLVEEALNREIYGESKERDALLAKAAETSPDYAPAHWHLGKVQIDGEWVDAASASAVLESDRRLENYRYFRSQQPDTVAGHLAIADWCEKRGMADQERAHLTRILTLEPEHAAARQRLGFRRVSGQWLLEADIKAVAERSREAQAAFAKWRPQIEELRDGLRRRGQAQRNAAKEKLLKIDDPAAIGAMEQVLSVEQESEAQLMVEVLAAMPQAEATMAISRQAVFSPFPAVREAASEKLSTRREDDYIPALLASMYTPITTQAEVLRAPGGRLLYRHAFAREGADAKELLVLDTSYVRDAEPGGDRRESLARALGDAWMTGRMREWGIAQANEATSMLNDRIAVALNSATNQDLPAEPEKWWSWWNEHNDVFVQGSKQVRAEQLSQEIVIEDQVVTDGGGQSGGQGGGQSMDCLAPGTPVWTSSGAVAIEKIQVGDLVLAQHPESGELAFKPVLSTTIRPAGDLIRVHINGEAISTSGGHPFWVSGEGWVKARNLRSGMVLHTSSGSATVSTVDAGEFSETHNLVVADFHNYFAGQNRVLSHDNTVRRATSAVVPGLVEK
jgi:hypothetical protein